MIVMLTMMTMMVMMMMSMVAIVTCRPLTRYSLLIKPTLPCIPIGPHITAAAQNLLNYQAMQIATNPLEVRGGAEIAVKKNPRT